MKQKRKLEGVSILTTDAEKRIGLYAIRYLGQAGGLVSGIAQTNGSDTPIGFLSRYAEKHIGIQKKNYFDELKKILISDVRSYQVINPIDISNMLFVMDTDKEHDLKCNYLLPKRDSLVIADNKELLTKYAQEIGLRCPKTFFRIPAREIRELCRSGLTFPCIIKFRGDSRETHWRPEERYAIVNSPKELLSAYQRMHEIEPYPIIQEYIRGQGFGYFALYDKKRNLKAQFCHKRVREYPVLGGPSSCCESTFDPDLIRTGRRLLESLEWSGLAMVEFKFDEVRKQHFIIEVNPRYWGSLPLAVYSGVNFPVLHMLSALGRDYAPVLEYKLGVRVRFLENDIKAIVAEMRVQESFRKKIGLFLEIFNPSVKDGLIALDDIGPLLGRVFRLKSRAGI